MIKLSGADVQVSTIRMVPLTLVVLFVVLAASANAGEIERIAVKRDDNLPARVPYVFPPPGTDAVRSEADRRDVS